MNMKRFFFALVVALMALPSMAQLRWGLVKEEGGFTNVRKGPGTKYAIVGKVLDGGFILISGDINDRWYKIYTQKGVLRGYISANKVMRLESPAF